MKKYLSLNEAANQILFESTRLKDIYLEELQTYSKVDRDIGERVISAAFFSLIRIDEIIETEVEKYNAHWFSFDEIPNLIFDHREMVDNAIQKLRSKARYQPIGFELLPKKITIPQLQLLYECIYQKKLDNRNFRRKILSFDILNKTSEKDKSGSKKGTFLYKFNRAKFNNFLAKGYNFEV
jgi:hypothetical protein